MHNSAFFPSFLYNFWNCNDFIISLNCGLNILDSISNRPSNVLLMVFSSFVSISKNCKPFLPNQFLTIANCSTCWVLFVDKILFISNLKVLHHVTCPPSPSWRWAASWQVHLSWALLLSVAFWLLWLPWLGLPLLLLWPLSLLWSHSLWFTCLPLFSSVSTCDF